MYIYGCTLVYLGMYGCISTDVRLCLYTHFAIEGGFLVYVGGGHDERIACFLRRSFAGKVRFSAVLVELSPCIGELL